MAAAAPELMLHTRAAIAATGRSARLASTFATPCGSSSTVAHRLLAMDAPGDEEAVETHHRRSGEIGPYRIADDEHPFSRDGLSAAYLGGGPQRQIVSRPIGFAGP